MKEYTRRVNQAKRENQIMFSKVFDNQIKMEKAKELLPFDSFWFPYSLDFRGRTYPIPPNFNHLGNDLSRGLLLFANGKPLGKSKYYVL